MNRNLCSSALNYNVEETADERAAEMETFRDGLELAIKEKKSRALALGKRKNFQFQSSLSF